MRTLPLNSLRAFDAAARHLNFRRASEEMNLTQGAVAQQVRQLESYLDVKLFHRQSRGLKLTEAGRSYSDSVRTALAIIEDATQSLLPVTTRIKLSVPPSFASKWLVPRLKSFAQIQPTIEVQTVASEGFADFRSDGVDLAIRQGQPPFGKGLVTILLSHLELSAVCSPEIAQGLCSIQSVEDFRALSLIHDGHGHWDRLLGQGDPGNSARRMKFNHSALAIDAALNGQGVALVPRILVEFDLQHKNLVEIWAEPKCNAPGFYIVEPEKR